MFGTHDLLLFIVSGLLLNVTPGPDTLYIVGRSSTQGFRAGATAAFGIGAGSFIHITAAVLGLSAILAASATAFTVVKVLGAAYLVYIGISLVRSSVSVSTPTTASDLAPATLSTVFLQGCMTNVFNPKVALFFLAFLPHFVDADAPSKWFAFVFLGAIFNVNGTLWNLFIAWSAARIGRGLRRSPTVTRWFNRCVGGIFFYLGVNLAFIAIADGTPNNSEVAR